MASEETAPGINPRADWRDAQDYKPLLDLDRVGWAGEWLRRNPEFLADLRRMHCPSTRVDGGHVFECGETCRLARWGVRCCRVDGEAVFFWLPECNPLVLTVEAEPACKADCKTDAFDCRRCPLLKSVMRMGEDGQHLLFSDGARHLQLAVARGDALAGPVLLRCHLCGLRDFETKPLSLQRLYRLARRGRLLKCLYPPERRAGRWLMMLRAWDGVQTGASQREIAAALFGERAVREDWDAGFLRTRVQRLIRGAEMLVGGGYRKLLK
jgi:hypothetical protein